MPDLTIGSSEDRRAVKLLCDDLNSRGLMVRGSVFTLTVTALEGETMRDLQTFTLDG